MLTDQDIVKIEQVLEPKFDSLKVQIRSLALDLKEVKQTVDKIDQRDLEDSNALMRTAVTHEQRIKAMEKILEIRKIKTA